MTRILITGGAGFIGSHTVIDLLKKGYEVIILDSYANSTEAYLKKLKSLIEIIDVNLIKNLNFYKGDIRQKDFLEGIFYKSLNDGMPIDGVIHFAGLKAVGESVIYPLKYWDVNFVGTLRLLETMDKYDCRTIIFSSSATIYGFPKETYISESSDINPVNPYGYSKSSIEILLKNVFDSQPNNWRIANLRYFNPIGAHPSGLIGEDPINYGGNLFPKLAEVAQGKCDHLIIFGNDWPTKDGTGIRDYIHVLDLADGHKAALEYLINSSPHSINFNLGTGIGTSVLDLINTFEKVNKISIPFVFSSRREGDIPISIADNSLALKKLNWVPSRNLEDMCKDFWRWKIENPEGYRN